MFWLEILAAAFVGALIAWLIMRDSATAERSALTARLEEVKAARDRLSESFEALSAEALRNNNKQFLDLAESTLARFQTAASGDLEKRQTAIDELVKPLKQSLDKVDQKIQAMEVTRSGAYASLSEQVKAMAESQIRLREETGKLAGALRTPAARGRWGEIQLRRVVEMAGMLEYCDFVEQESVGTEDGRLRPDLTVRLPNGKRVVVDSKVPLKAYLEALETPDEAGRASKLREHAMQVRKHLSKLGEKGYWTQFPSCPEFVVAFLPGEIFFSAALQADPELIEHGVERNVILATPTTLIALLRAVSFGWRQEQVAENAQEIRDLGATLYERIRVFAAHYDEMGKSLGKAVSCYAKGKNSMDTRLIGAARKLKDLGASKSGDIDEVYTIPAVAEWMADTAAPSEVAQ